MWLYKKLAFQNWKKFGELKSKKAKKMGKECHDNEAQNNIHWN